MTESKVYVAFILLNDLPWRRQQSDDITGASNSNVCKLQESRMSQRECVGGVENWKVYVCL